MRKPQEGDLVMVEPMEAWPNVGVLVTVQPRLRYARPFGVRMLRPFNSNVWVDVAKVDRCIVNFAGVVRL